MQRRERTCDCCGKVEFVFTRTDTCHECHISAKRADHISAEREKLVELYSDVEGPMLNKHVQRTWTFTHHCGTRQTWTFSNLLKQLKNRPNSVPCKECGGKERMSKAMAAFVEKYRIKDWQEWRDYKRHVIKLTNANWKLHEAVINPAGYIRGVHEYHLDHKKSVIQCFLDGDAPEFAARCENLEMLPAFDNLSKGRKCS